jgi:hypothetical protein
MDEKPKIINIGKKNEMLAIIEKLKRNLPEIKEQVELIAEIRKANFDAHIKHGFTPEQALELCKTMLI